jgi:hypothetical protein
LTARKTIMRIDLKGNNWSKRMNIRIKYWYHFSCEVDKF